MADVFLARRRGAAGIAKRLVVKRMRQELTSDPRFADLFLREARVATQLSHKNIVTVFDVGRDQDGLFLAMEYVEGPDLAAAMQGARELGLRFEPLLAAHIASEVAAGLDQAHRARDERGAALGLVHRDVTPRNILLSLDGEVKVTDFGVAVLHGDSADERRGTVPYMSPEQARGQPVDPRADLFSLGLVLYEILAGRRAHEGGDKDAVLAMARAGQVPPPGPDVPAELARIVARATALDPDDRFASARDMQRELAGWAVGERGRCGQTEPLEHALASFLATVVPGWAERSGRDAAGRTVGVPGTATLRSVAETAGDDPAPAARKLGATESTRSARWPARLAAGVAIAAVTAAVLIATTRGEGSGAVDAAGERADPATAPAPTSIAAAAPAAAPAGVSESTTAGAAAADPAPDPAPAAHPAPMADPPPDPAAARRGDPAAQSAAGKAATRSRRLSGRLDLNVVPWAYVSIDGGSEEETPIRGRVLGVGRHKIVIRNPVLERRREIAVDISPGETTRYVVDLRR
jgi:tRNA A-37 threonylcarbamoyl transferase component Bud32